LIATIQCLQQVLDADGSLVGLYRKSHISDCEKPYVSPGDTGFRVFNTFYGTIGVGIGWDQWYPEAARAMVLQGGLLCEFVFSESISHYLWCE
jgi:N-carbamoylputrescine amidase